ncbi:hypothetical protein ACWGTO_08770 [Mesorhizobium sp. PL10]
MLLIVQRIPGPGSMPGAHCLGMALIMIPIGQCDSPSLVESETETALNDQNGCYREPERSVPAYVGRSLGCNHTLHVLRLAKAGSAGIGHSQAGLT